MVYKLDKKDRAILYQLDLDSRQSFKQIAKKVGLSREVVQYRTKQLEKNSVIKGYQTMIDVTKLGYINCRFFIKLQKDTPEQENKIIGYYKKHPKFWWVDSIDGFRDLGLACWVKNIYEFYELREDLMKRFGDYIFELDMSIYCKFYIYKRDYLNDKKSKILPEVKVMFFPEKSDFDSIDLEILRLISANARMSSVDISKKTKISITNVTYRIKKMIEKGIIKDFRVILDLEKIGYYWYKIEIQLEDLTIKEKMLDYFHRHPNIIYAYETISDNDLEFEMEVESYEEFRKILNDIRNLFGKSIKKYHHLLWFKEHKFLFMP
ncbi:MAG: winged helix-turn-helix transcriptional regulator [Candidatus Pacearchaeota archaeon]